MEIKEYARLQQKLLKAQLRVLRDVVGPAEDEPTPSTGSARKRRSKIGIVEDLLRDASQPLHITQIVQIAEQRFGLSLDRDSLVSALTKKVRKGDTFVRVGRNTFGLVDR